ncbi:helix-turn-helix domain-containing protein [Leptospira bandrabouensis]|uniref:XRE family transcriptional regulator n=1 Tax=Leptospira bandrabouensis TaxID=2484903 RepID=UPI00223CCBC3|nr:XRE family transcriptional regulator [Leptospira bandrabouensis]MCW7479439.1 helix-turn-helix domain-containing protein [Leptospira bandrabouensis]MCW7487122.1 helix-turn-helix domain-containing protein [Leptospira bandrabouensis]
MKAKEKRNPIENLEKSLSSESVARAKHKAEKMLFQINLAELRKQVGLRQEDISSFSQSGLSKLESRKDMKISTLIDYLDSLGMDLEIKARVRSKKDGKSKKEFVLLKAS